MSYTKLTDFGAKDSLPSGDPDKIVKGSEINTEFNNIQTAIQTLTSTVSGLSGTSAITSVNSVSSGKMLTYGSSYSAYQTAPNPGFVVVWTTNNQQGANGIDIAMNGGQARSYNAQEGTVYVQYFKVGFGTD